MEKESWSERQQQAHPPVVCNIENWKASGVVRAFRIAQEKGVGARLSTRRFSSQDPERPVLLLYTPPGKGLDDFWTALRTEDPNYYKRKP